MSDGLISANVPLPRFREWYAATCHVEDRRSARLWGGSALGVVALTGAALFWAVMSAHPQPILVAEPSPAAISIDLAPVPVPVSAPQQDVDPAPQQAVPRPDEPVFLTVKADHNLALGENDVPAAQLTEALAAATKGNRDERIFLRADKTVDYGTLMDVMDHLRSAGYLKVALVTLQGQTTGTTP